MARGTITTLWVSPSSMSGPRPVFGVDRAQRRQNGDRDDAADDDGDPDQPITIIDDTIADNVGFVRARLDLCAPSTPCWIPTASHAAELLVAEHRDRWFARWKLLKRSSLDK
jgi:hypothetical protein